MSKSPAKNIGLCHRIPKRPNSKKKKTRMPAVNQNISVCLSEEQVDFHKEKPLRTPVNLNTESPLIQKYMYLLKKLSKTFFPSLLKT
jgi:hypothetical protein